MLPCPSSAELEFPNGLCTLPERMRTLKVSDMHLKAVVYGGKDFASLGALFVGHVKGVQGS
jgi:hypothetical protein